ncbi:S8 family serine peptidase, partial [bacterium]|nr:S8 family serine peptidase [bacterium]
ADVNHEWGWHPWNSEDHGSHCAGIAAGVTNNLIGIAGTSHNSKIMACKIFPYVSDVAAANALIYAADNGADILSNSWGGGGSSETIQSAILYARNMQNCVVLFAAGNDNSSSPHYPGANDGVICVGATNPSDGRASFSNYGAWVDMCSPGTGIWSCLDPENPAHNNLYAAWDGTSMATPLVAGVAALVKSQYPGMSVDDIESRLLDGDDVGSLQMGFRVNSLKALSAFNISHTPQMNITDPGEPIPISAEIFAGDGVALTVTLNYSVSGSIFTDIDMVEDMPGIWSTNIPSQAGGSVVEYYIHVADDAGNEAYHPISAPTNPHFFLVGSLGFFNTISYDDVETNQSWSLGIAGDNASAGIWIREDPVGTWEGADPVQPEDDHTPGGTICFVTGNAIFTGDNAGANDVDGGWTTLESPQLPITAGVSPILSYWRWYSNDLGFSPGSDTWQVMVRNQDDLWITLEQTNESNNSWSEKQFLLDNYLPNSTFIQLRFIAEDAGDGSLVEAAVDDIRLFYAGESAFIPGDLNMDAMINVQDLVLLVAHIMGTSFLEGNAVFAADFNLDTDINIQDVVLLVSAILG